MGSISALCSHGILWNKCPLSLLQSSRAGTMSFKRILSSIHPSCDTPGMQETCQPHGQAEEGLLLFHRMQLEGVVPDKVMCLSILEACGSLADLSEGQRTHACIVCCGFEADVVVGTALVHMYGKCGSQQDLSRMFCKMPERNVVSWNAIIAAHAQHGQSKEALNLFQQMKLQGMFPNKATFLSILEACVNQATMSNCQEMHTEIILAGLESEVAVGTALVYMYGKCGWIEDAERLLDKMLKRDIIAWNAMIAAYALHQLGKQALQLFWQMQLEGMIPDKSTFSSLLDACANKAALAEGKQVHALVLESGLDSSPIVGTAIVNMYGKCGCLQDAMCFFNRMRDRDVIAWSAVIAAHAQQGQGKEAVKLFQEMQSEGVVPNDVTYFSILSACSHAGLMVEGQYFFQTMTESHAISPTVQHYNCMIDLLGRVGRLDEGELLISRMAVQPNATSWLTLLSACRRHSDVERGKRVAQRLLDLDPERTAAYVLLSNMYAENGMVNELPMLMHPVEGTELN